MSKKNEAASGAELDADGLVVQKYKSVVLLVVPPSEYGEECLRYARSSLYNVHVGTRSVSTNAGELIKGRHQDEFMVDEALEGVSLEAYSGVIFVGGEGAAKLADNPDALRLAREAAQSRKLLAAWGRSVEILARAGVVKGKRVTGDAQLRALVEKAGGKFSTRQVEVDGQLVTGLDEAAGMRFGKALAAIVGI
jgi:putative intracellular protease/amidase